MNQQLRQINDLIKQRRFTQARHALEDYLALHDNDADAWYLRSFVEPSRDEKIAALKRALAWTPGHARAMARLNKIQRSRPERRRGKSRTPLLVALLFALVVVFGMAAFLASQKLTPPAVSVPTVMVLEATVSETPKVVVVGATFSAVPPPDAMQAALTANAFATPLPFPTFLTVIASTASPTQEERPPMRPSATASDVPPTNAPMREPTAAPTEPPATATPPLAAAQPSETPRTSSAAPTVPTRRSASFPTSAPTTEAPTSAAPTTTAPTTTATADTGSDAGVALGRPLNVGIGEMRVVAVTNPGEQAIRDLGGTVPNAPANVNWVLVEALLACTNTSQCRVSPSAIRLVDGEGTEYGMPAQFQIEPIFGSSSFNGQTWGYLGFLVADDAENLRLRLTRDGQPYTFALE